MNSPDDEVEYRRGVEQQRRAARSYNLTQLRGAVFMAGGLLSIPALVALGINGGWLGPALVSNSMIEFRLLLLCQALGALLMLIGAIGKGVQIGLASDRARQ